jgi:hypothetical protein
MDLTKSPYEVHAWRKEGRRKEGERRAPNKAGLLGPSLIKWN